VSWSGRARLLAALVAAAAGVAGGPSARSAWLPAARAAEPWRVEFDAICAKTQDAMALPLDELRGLVARADKLMADLEALEPSARKVYLKRLQACRNLYQFVLESKEKA
jgi:hypothetical protein